MPIAILATGDEIVWGDTLNTNGQKIAHLLHTEGLNVGNHMTVSDRLDDITNALHYLNAKHDTLIIIGGLGPTSDDRTRFALARHINEPLFEHPEALSHITNRLQRANLVPNELNKQQALFPKNARLLPNPNGTALGAEIRSGSSRFYLLPGPPRECLPMFETSVLPYLQKDADNEILLKWLLFGVAESQVAEVLEKALAHLPVTLGYRLMMPYLEFKVRAEAPLKQAICDIVLPLVTPHLLMGTEKASTALLRSLALFKGRISIIDEATGGQLQLALQNPTTYEKLCFYEAHTPIEFHIKGLQAYWQPTGETHETTLTIDYRNADKIGHEQHSLPYRGTAHVLPLAVEFLCMRLFHLINQLHEIKT